MIARTLIAALTLALVVSVGAVARAGTSSTGAATLTIRATKYGRILFDGRGRALYAFTRDARGGASRCYGACAKAWPVDFAKGRLLAGTSVKQALIGTTRRRDGRLQVTYGGRPLYYYAGDGVGQVKCQGVAEFGGTWLVVRASGQLVRSR
jgi:predicted lipoprotein with Yx(FWY)xxD motif